MKTCRLETRGLSMAYDEAGHGTPLVLLHAFPFDHEMWKPQLESLAEVAHVIAPDLPGFGQSTAGFETFTIENTASIVAEFLAAIGIKESIVLGGLSMGGYVAMAFARLYAEYLRGLILADTKAEPDDEAAKANRAKIIALAHEKGTAGVVATMLPKLLADVTRMQKPSVVQDVEKIGNRQPVTTVTNALAALRDRPDAKPGLSAVNVPMLIIVGEHDSITPPTAAEGIRSVVRGSELLRIPDAGHLSNLENPEAFNAAVRLFLTSHA